MKTKMKFAVCALVCMTMACAAASAEGSQPGGMGGNRPQMQQGQMRDDRKNGMQQGQALDMNGQNHAQNDRKPGEGAQGGQQKPDDQNAPKDMPTRLDAKKLLEDGVIDEDTYNAIEAYLKENAPEKPEGEAGETQQPPEKPENDQQDDAQQPPEKPDGETDDDSAEKPELPEIGGGLDEIQLKTLLDAGVITQEQYDALVKLLESSENAA